MAGRFQPPPTFAAPIELDEFGVAHFSPIWLGWFNALAAPLGVDGTSSEVITDGILVNSMFRLRVPTDYADRALDSNSQHILEGQIFGP